MSTSNGPNGAANSPTAAPLRNGAPKNSTITGRTSQGIEIHAALLRLTRYAAVFELYNPDLVLRASEVIENGKVFVVGRAIYSGRIVIKNLIQTGTTQVCEAALEDFWLASEFFFPNTDKTTGSDFSDFLKQWQKNYQIRPEFKVVVADMQTFLSDLKLWLEQIELNIQAYPPHERAELERRVIDKLSVQITRSMDVFTERFEEIVKPLEAELHPLYRSHLRRQLHPLILSSPFAYRAYSKPLGYAGDYEIVEMMLRPPCEGKTLFAKILNIWLLNQVPAEAHRNRVKYLTQKLALESTRAQSQRRTARVFNMGCGPAAEVRNFLRDYRSAERTELALVDFNQETLQRLDHLISEIKRDYKSEASVKLANKSVQQLLKESCRGESRPSPEQYDFVYCAGLFDYLSDEVCRRLMNTFYGMLIPGGLLLATNATHAMNSSRPFRYSMEYILDWHLVYRDGSQMAGLAPEKAPSDSVSCVIEHTGANIVIEVRKPQNA